MCYHAAKLKAQDISNRQAETLSKHANITAIFPSNQTFESTLLSILGPGQREDRGNGDICHV
jgi:hypothetical protein